jgi:hypothetical protein
VSTIEELLGRNSRESGLENQENNRRVALRWPRDTLYPQKIDTNFDHKRLPQSSSPHNIVTNVILFYVPFVGDGFAVIVTNEVTSCGRY